MQRPCKRRRKSVRGGQKPEALTPNLSLLAVNGKRSVDLISRHSFRGFAAWRLFLIVSGVDVDKQGSATLKEC
jgi:hypothetical protein